MFVGRKNYWMTEYQNIKYVYDGMEVYFRRKNKFILCKVECAMGNTARVVNQLHKINTWAAVDDELFIIKESYGASNY